MDFRAEPPLDALLVNVLQTAGTVARLDQGVGGRLLAHLADPAQVALLLVRLLQQQSGDEDIKKLYVSNSYLVNDLRCLNISKHYTL